MFQQNGTPLSKEQGGPFRIAVLDPAGSQVITEGSGWVKWVNRIEVRWNGAPAPAALAVLLLLALLAGCTTDAPARTPVTVMVAGSLVDPLAGFEAEYEAAHPASTSGSRAPARSRRYGR